MAAITKQEFITIAQEEGVPEDLQAVAMRIWGIESGQGSDGFLKSPKGALGPGQIMPNTWKEVVTLPGPVPISNINDPRENIRGSLRYLKQGYERSGGDLFKTAAYYHGGPKTLDMNSQQLRQLNDGLSATYDYAAKATGKDPDFSRLAASSLDFDSLLARASKAGMAAVDAQANATVADSQQVSQLLTMFGLKANESPNIKALGERFTRNNAEMLKLSSMMETPTDSVLGQLVIGYGRDQVFAQESAAYRGLAAENEILSETLRKQVTLADALATINIKGDSKTREALVRAEGNAKRADIELKQNQLAEDNLRKRIETKSKIEEREQKQVDTARELEVINKNLKALGAEPVNETGFKDMMRTNKQLAAAVSAGDITKPGGLAGVLQNPDKARTFYSTTKIAPTGSEAGKLFLRGDSYFAQELTKQSNYDPLKDATKPTREEIGQRAAQAMTQAQYTRNPNVYDQLVPADDMYGAHSVTLIYADTTIPSVLAMRQTLFGQELRKYLEAEAGSKITRLLLSDNNILGFAQNLLPEYLAAGKKPIDLAKDVAAYFQAATEANNYRWKFEEAGLPEQKGYYYRTAQEARKNPADKNAKETLASRDLTDPTIVFNLIRKQEKDANANANAGMPEGTIQFRYGQ